MSIFDIPCRGQVFLKPPTNRPPTDHLPPTNRPTDQLPPTNKKYEDQKFYNKY